MCLTRKQTGNEDMSRTPEKNVVLYTNSTETKRLSHWTHRIVTPLSENISFRNWNQAKPTCLSYHMMVHRLLSSVGCCCPGGYLFDSDGLYVNSEVSRPYFSRMRVLQASFLLGR